MITIDGWITIGTKLNTDKFDRQMTDLENKIDSEEKKQELLNKKTKEYEENLSLANKEVKSLSSEYERATEKAEQLANKVRDIKNATPRKGAFEIVSVESEYEEQVKLVDELSAKLDVAEKKQASIQDKVEKTKIQYENSSKAVDRLRGKVSEITTKRQQDEFKSLENSVNNVKNGITGAIGQLGKMALAVFGVRSAYNALRRASSSLAQYNEQYAKDIEYIGFALTNTLAPILEKIVSVVQTIMAYINYITTALFGKAIFASAKEFEKMSKSAGKTAKSAKEIKNNLASFDELNILSQGNKGEDSAEGGVAPSIDFGDIEEIELPDWFLNLINEITEIVENLSSDILDIIIPLGTEITKTAVTLFETLKNLIKSFYSGGILPVIELIRSIWSGLWDSIKKAWDNWGVVIFENLRTAIVSVGEVIQSLWGNILEPVWKNLMNVIGMLWTDHLKPLLDNLLDLFGELINGVLEIWNKTLQPFVMWIIDNFGPPIAKVINYIVDMFGSALGSIIDVVNGIIRSLKGIIEFIVGVFTGDWEKAWTGIEDFFGGIWDGITAIVKGAINLIIMFINGMIAGIETALNWVVDKINSLEITNPFTGEEIWSPHVQRFEFGRIPKLAKGGVVAKPTQAIIGEAGREAIMPLDSNTDWMDILADKISETISGGEQQLIIRFEGTMGQLVRELKPQFELENKRVGTKIIKGGAY